METFEDDKIFSQLEQGMRSPILPNLKRGEYALELMSERMGFENVPYIKTYYFKNKRNHPQVINSKDIYTFFRAVWDMETIELQESVCLVLIDKQHRVIGYCFPFKGGVDSAGIDVRILIAIALQSIAVQVAIAHNHPSGNIRPSDADITFSRMLQYLLWLFNIELIDSMTLTMEDYVSMADENLIWNEETLRKNKNYSLVMNSINQHFAPTWGEIKPFYEAPVK
jgi:DNA repair protein RadC